MPAIFRSRGKERVDKERTFQSRSHGLRIRGTKATLTHLPVSGSAGRGPGATFVQVLRLCREAGLVKLGVVGLDGTKVEANAALAANRRDETIEEEVRHYPFSRLLISQFTKAMCVARVTECWKIICSSFPPLVNPLSNNSSRSRSPSWEILPRML